MIAIFIGENNSLGALVEIIRHAVQFQRVSRWAGGCGAHHWGSCGPLGRDGGQFGNTLELNALLLIRCGCNRRLV